MLSMGFITEKACKEAKAEEITVNRQRVPLHNYETTYAIDCAIRYPMRRDGFEFQYGFRSDEAYKEYNANYNEECTTRERDALYTGGYNLYTSLDPDKQTILQDALDGVLSFDGNTSETAFTSCKARPPLLTTRRTASWRLWVDAVRDGYLH